MDTPNSLIAKALIAREFPDFDCSTLPTDIPEFLVAQPWRNEACPAWRADAHDSLELWIDYADVSLREHPDTPGRFLVQTLDTSLASNEATVIYHDDDWERAKAALLAAVFAHTLGQHLTPDEMAQAIALNADLPADDTRTCHTQDFCDANMAMDEAFHLLFGRSFVPDEGEPTEQDFKLWNAAWTMARSNRFWAPVATPPAPAHDAPHDPLLEPAKPIDGPTLARAQAILARAQTELAALINAFQTMVEFHDGTDDGDNPILADARALLARILGEG